MNLLASTLVPYARDGRVDPAALRAHTLWVLGHGVTGLAPLLAEFLWLRPPEKEQVLQVVADAAGGRPFLPNVWDADPNVAIRLAALAASLGAKAVVLPPPMVDPIGDDGVVAWYRVIGRTVTVPVVAWHHPRFGPDLTPRLLGRMRAEAGVAGVLDASGDAFRARRTAEDWAQRAWAGGDEVLPSLLDAPGLVGGVSDLAGLYPELGRRLFLEGDRALADAWTTRAAVIRRAGGLPAIKRLLGLGSRVPFVGADEALRKDLPPAGFR